MGEEPRDGGTQETCQGSQTFSQKIWKATERFKKLFWAAWQVDLEQVGDVANSPTSQLERMLAWTSLVTPYGEQDINSSCTAFSEGNFTVSAECGQIAFEFNLIK